MNWHFNFKWYAEIIFKYFWSVSNLPIELISCATNLYIYKYLNTYLNHNHNYWHWHWKPNVEINISLLFNQYPVLLWILFIILLLNEMYNYWKSWINAWSMLEVKICSKTLILTWIRPYQHNVCFYSWPTNSSIA